MIRTRVLTMTTLGHPVTIVENHTPGNAPTPVPTDLRLLCVGGVHGDEPEGVTLATDLIRSWESMPTSFQWAVIPCLNPDGYFSQTHRRTNARSVDLNRNFPSTDWKKLSRAPRYFPGTHPNSELETQGLVRLAHDFKPDLIIHFHSYNYPCVVYTGIDGKAISEMISEVCGYPAREDIGYPTPGSLGQYGWMDLKVPVVCIEEREGVPLSTIWPRFAAAFTELIKSPERYILTRRSGV